jgi:hypothetical protein
LDYRSETSAPQGDNANQPEIEANDVEVQEDNQSGIEATITRSGRTVTPPERLNLYQQQTEEAPTHETPDESSLTLCMNST